MPSSLEMMAFAGCLDVNLSSPFSSSSTNKPDKSKPDENEMISKAFRGDTQPIEHIRSPRMTKHQLLHRRSLSYLSLREQHMRVSHKWCELSFDHLVKELTALNIFHDEVNLSLARHNLVKMHYTRVLNEPHHRDLPFDLIHHSRFENLVLVDDLNGNAHAILEIPRMIHLRKAPLSYQFP
nr:hypothetical protein MIMGU_mgv1a014340mg [Ipomoea batatas]